MQKQSKIIQLKNSILNKSSNSKIPKKNGNSVCNNDDGVKNIHNQLFVANTFFSPWRQKSQTY